MSEIEPRVQSVRPEQEIMTLQRLPYFIGISGQTVHATGLWSSSRRGRGRSRTSISATRQASTCWRESSAPVGGHSWSTRWSAKPASSCSFPLGFPMRPSTSVQPRLHAPSWPGTTRPNRTKSNHSWLGRGNESTSLADTLFLLALTGMVGSGFIMVYAVL